MKSLLGDLLLNSISAEVVKMELDSRAVFVSTVVCER